MTDFKRFLSNKVTIYLVTRYIVYFITFVTSMIMAGRLGPYYMGIWGSIVLLLRYFQIFDFGIANSMTVLLVQNKKDASKCANLEMSAMALMCAISLFVVVIGGYYMFVGIPFLDKFDLDHRFYLVCLIAIFQYFNDYAFRISRVKGRMFEFTFYQTFLQVLLLPVVFLAHEDFLISILIITYIFAHFISLCLFVFRGSLSFRGRFIIDLAKTILVKGFYLFIYNFCFYLIILSTKTIIADNYKVEEFGYFSFAYTLAHAALLLLTAFSSLITPKLIDKFNTNNTDEIEQTVSLIRTNYVACSHGVMYLAMAFFPLLLCFLPKYRSALMAINLTALAVLLYTNSFGYVSLLMTKNRERSLAFNTFITLAINAALAWGLAVLLKVDYSYVIFATLFSHLFYAFLVVYRGRQLLQKSNSFCGMVNEVIPIRQLLPFVIACTFSMINNSFLMWIPFVIFILFNLQDIKGIVRTVKTVMQRPNVIDVK